MNIVLLDRDGTVIVDPPDERVDTVEKIKLFEDSISALKYLADNDFAVILITNQAGIAEGRISEEQFWSIHNVVLEKLAPSGVRILKTYMNGEGPGPEASEWRKPGPKMLLQAAEELSFSIGDVYMVGDNKSDVQAGINAGCKGGILVKTANKNVESPEAVFTGETLTDVVKFIVANK